MKKSRKQLDDVFHQVDRYIRNMMSKEEKDKFFRKLKNDKFFCNMVCFVCSLIKKVKTPSDN